MAFSVPVTVNERQERYSEMISCLDAYTICGGDIIRPALRGIFVQSPSATAYVDSTGRGAL